MSNFIDNVLAYNEEKSVRPDPLDMIPALEATFETLRSEGLISSVSFRIPVTINPVLDEILSMTPYQTKGELVYVMLQQQIEEFISVLPKSSDLLNNVAESVIERHQNSGASEDQKEVYKEVQEELL